jgi:uncharacterized membrane protein
MTASTIAPDAPPAGKVKPLATRRLVVVDVARGAAVAAMIVYHASWDLQFLRLAPIDVVSQPVWRGFAILIAGAFLALVGVSLVLATRDGFDRAAFLRRLAIVAAAAGAVTLATYFAMPERFIFFGILHCIAVASVLALPFLAAPIWVVALAAAAVAVTPKFIALPIFDHPALLWVGLGTTPPVTNDYEPIFPWLAPVLLGVALGRVALGMRGVDWWQRLRLVGPASRALSFAGRHSLMIYLTHQLVLFGALWLVLQATGPSAAAERMLLMDNCAASCRDGGGETRPCRISCRCSIEAVKRLGLWREVVSNRLSATDRLEVSAAVRQCRAQAFP